MKTVTKKTIDVEVVTYKCDFCEHKWSTEKLKGRIWPGSGERIYSCDLCAQHICFTHRHRFKEDSWSEDLDFEICPQCEPAFRPAWEWALENAGRHDSIRDVAMRRWVETQELRKQTTEEPAS